MIVIGLAILFRGAQAAQDFGLSSLESVGISNLPYAADPVGLVFLITGILANSGAAMLGVIEFYKLRRGGK